MAKKLLTAYTFTPGAANAGTVVVSGSYALEQFLLITNVTTGATVYQFNKPVKGGAVNTSGGNTTLTLEADTSAMSSSDRLQVFVDDAISGTSVVVSNGASSPVPVSDAGGSLTVDGTVGISGTVPVSAASLPLPTGAATSANQSTANSSLASLDGKAPALVAGRVPVDGSGVTQPVSGPLTDTELRASAVSVAPNITRGSGVADANTQRVTLASDGLAVTALSSIDSKTPALVSGRQPVDGSGVTQPISAASLPLPTGASTSANQTTGNASLSSIDGKLPALSVGGRVLVDGSGVTQPVSGTVTATGPLTDAQLRASAVPVSGPLTDTQLRATAVPVSASSLPLPTGAATAAKQPALGTAGTPSTDVITVQGAATGTSLPVSAASLPLPTGAATSTLQTTGNTSLSSIDSKTAILVSGRVPVDGSAVTQPVSGTVTANAGTNLNTSLLALENGGNLAGIRTDLGTDGITPPTLPGGSTGVRGWLRYIASLLPTALVGGRFSVDGSGVTQPISATTLPLPTGAATETTLSSVNTKVPTQGQAAMAASLPVVIASNQSAVSVNSSPVPALLTSYSQAGVIAINTVLATLDCSQYRSISVQCTSMGTTGVVTPEWSNDNSNWVAATILTPAGATATTFNAAGLWTVPVLARYLRLRLSTATTAGTTTLSIHQFDDSRQIWLATQPVSGTVTANIGIGSLAAGTNAIGDVGVQYRANATGAASSVSVLSPATPAAATIKATAGRLLAYSLQNSATTLRSVKIFNVAAPTLGTTSATFEIDIPAGAAVQLELPGGIAFTTAMTYSVTSAKGLTDNTSTGLAANDVSGFFAYA